MLHCSKPLLAAHEPCIDKLRPYNIYNHLGGGGVPRYLWSGGGLVGFSWDGGCIPLSGISVGWWHFGGVSNGILMEVLKSSVGVPFGSSTGGVAGPLGFQMVRCDSLCSTGTPLVSRCFCMWCGFSLFSNDLLNILIKSLHRVLAWKWDGVTCL